ncbi:MAG: phosphoribosylanthranilate isomerase [Bacteroidota bacterium]
MNHNTAEVAALQPDYMGFIFYAKSSRNFTGTPPIPLPSIKRVGVFVDATLEDISKKIKTFNLDIVQLHGDETPAFCEAVSDAEVWKVFSIKDAFDFDRLIPYETGVDKFLFDTKGKEKGGNGYTFDWKILEAYNSAKPFILSGGIGLDEVESLQQILKTELPIHALDVNSKFELAPGLKNIQQLTEFMSHFK